MEGYNPSQRSFCTPLLFNLSTEAAKCEGRSRKKHNLQVIWNIKIIIFLWYEAWRLFCAKIAWRKKIFFFIYLNKGLNCRRWLFNFSLSYFSITMIFYKDKKDVLFFLTNKRLFFVFYCIYMIITISAEINIFIIIYL